MLRKTPFILEEKYHIYNRGVEKRNIFMNKGDYTRFMLLLYISNSKESVHLSNLLYQGPSLIELFGVERREVLVDIGAYCLMPNHFHLLLSEKTEGGISSFMKKLSTGYAMYFNKKNERTGSLFEGIFKAKHIDNEPYFNWIFSYIHLNPVKLIDSKWKENGISDPIVARNFMRNYKYSSYYDYFIGNRSEGAIVNKDAFPEYFAQLNDFEDIVKEFFVGVEDGA